MIPVMNDQNSDILNQHQHLVLFWAPWCRFCGQVKEYLPKLIEDGFSVFACDIEQSPELADRNALLSLPTIIFYDNGKETTRIVGAKTYEQTKSELRQ